MTATLRVVDDSEIYGVEFRNAEGCIQWRHNRELCQHSSAPDWRPLMKIVGSAITCELGWTPERLRLWADLLEHPTAETPKSPADFPVETPAFSGGNEAI